MKIAPHIGTPVARDKVVVPSPVKVCLHVLGNSRTDVRAMRAATTLVEAGYFVSLVDFEGESQYTQLKEDSSGINMRHITVPDSFFTTRFKQWVLIRALWIFIRAALRLIRTTADIYHAFDLPALPACYIVAKLRRKPVIFEAYELPLSTLPLSELSTSRRLLQAILAPLLAHMLPRCAGVITVSPPIVQEMSKRYHCSNISLVRNIPPYKTTAKSDRLQQRLGLDPKVRIALYQGNLQPDRGLDKLVRAAPFLDENIVIVLMGKDMIGTQVRLETLITDEGVANRVKIIPPVPQEDLLDWVASADLGLIVYAPDYSLNVRLMLPNKFFECLMAGLPILASELDAVAEIIRTYNVGRIVYSLDPKDVGAAINAMLANRDDLARMRSNAFDAAQHEFYWEQERQELTRLYDNVRTRVDTLKLRKPD